MLANGVVVIPLTVCGEPMVVRSRDEGLTWTGVRHRRDDSLGLDDIVAGDEGLVLGITDHVWSENLAVDEHDNLFFAYLADGVRLVTSRDGGRSWRLLGFVSSPDIRRAIVVSVAARGRGEVALTYYGTPDKGDAFGASGYELARVDDLRPQRARRRSGVPLGPDLARIGADHGRGHVRLLHDRPDVPRVHRRPVRVADARSAARSPAGPASTCPSSCSRSCVSPPGQPLAGRTDGSRCASGVACVA